MKKAKGKAFKSFKHIKCDLKVVELINRYKKHHEINKIYTKHPSTWLNNECWLDDEVSGPIITTITPQEFVDGYRLFGQEGMYDLFEKDNKRYRKHRFKKNAEMELD